VVPDHFEHELLENILPFWMNVAPDTENGGFYGQIGVNNVIQNDIPRTAITCSRILWTFSHAYLIYQRKEYLTTALRAFDYLNTAFWDAENGGLFWSVDRFGKPVASHKHFYAQAFGIYGFSEFFRATQDPFSLERAIDLFHILERHAFDHRYGGYIEACDRQFRSISDKRLSEKDMNCSKSMNTMLHIMEAFTNLLRVWNDPLLRDQLQHLLMDFSTHILNDQTNHLMLFFNEDWSSLSERFSCGHDIESSWLLAEAADMLDDQDLRKNIKEISLRLANSVLESGIQPDGSVISEGITDRTMTLSKEWWPQAEAVVGFYNAYQLSGEEKYLKIVPITWNYLQNHFIDEEHGGWYKRVAQDGSIDPHSPKIGPWECPYHESRMCFEMIRRIRGQEIRNGK